MNPGDVRYRKFRVLDENGFDTFGRVTAAILYRGEAYGGYNYEVQFSYCSPKEHNENKNIGHAIALLRLKFGPEGRGPIKIVLHPEDRNKPRMGLTSAVKNAIIEESKRKNIRWLNQLAPYQLV